MLHLLKKPTGIDYYIQAAQVLLWNKLSAKWGASGVASDQFEFYGRSQKAYRNDGYEPNVYKVNSPNGKEYVEVLLNDKVAATMWFALQDAEKVDQTIHRFKVSLYGFVNLNRIIPDDNGQREDMQAVNDVVNCLDTQFGFQVTDVFHGVDKVLSDYSGSKIKEGVKIFNMQPYMCFRIDTVNLQQININSTNCPPYFVYPPDYKTMVCSITCEFKDAPDSSDMQTLCNGRQIAAQYLAGVDTVEIPHLIGRLPLKVMYYNRTPVVFNFDSETGTVTNTGGLFYDGDILIIEYNENI